MNESVTDYPGLMNLKERRGVYDRIIWTFKLCAYVSHRFFVFQYVWLRFIIHIIILQ